MGQKFLLSRHATHRMDERAINQTQIEQVLDFGRTSYNRNALIFAIGRKEVKEYGRFLEDCQGLHVVCSVDDGRIMTAYRSQNLHGLRH